MNDFGTLHLKDEKFNPAQSREMELLIKITPKRISYAIVSDRENSLLLLYDAPIAQSVEDDLSDLLINNDYLRLPFAKIKASVQTLNFTFIPLQYYTRDNMSGYEQIIQASDDTKTFVSTINAESVNCVIALEMNTIAPLIGAFSLLRLLSQAEPLIQGGLKVKSALRDKLVLQFNEDSFEVYAHIADKFVLYNLYAFENAEDFNYYLILVMQQLAIDADKTSIILAGDITTEDANYKRIEKYFSNISFADSSEFTTFSTHFNSIPKHKYFSLISLLLCE